MIKNAKNLFSAESPMAFCLPLLFCPLLIIAWFYGGITILLTPLFGYVIVTIFDFIMGENMKQNSSVERNSPNYKIILYIWPLIQMFLIFGTLIVIFKFNHLNFYESAALMLVVGIVTGAVGITFAHELMHQSNKKERFLADILMGMAMYGHFRTEHLLVHHRHVGTKGDAVTARFNESFYLFFLRVIPECLKSAWFVEKERLRKKGLSVLNRSNPFYIYFSLSFLFLFLAYLIGGFLAVVFFILQALIAVLHLEVVNYIEHYGLSRQKLTDDKYEPTQAFHSWNSNHKTSNLLLINLQKHSDHHARPNKAYPLLRAHDECAAPQLPFGYPLMVLLSLFPIYWRKVMNPKVLEWREQFYPEIYDWSALK